MLEINYIKKLRFLFLALIATGLLWTVMAASGSRSLLDQPESESYVKVSFTKVSGKAEVGKPIRAGVVVRLGAIPDADNLALVAEAVLSSEGGESRSSIVVPNRRPGTETRIILSTNLPLVPVVPGKAAVTVLAYVQHAGKRHSGEASFQVEISGEEDNLYLAPDGALVTVSPSPAVVGETLNVTVAYRLVNRFGASSQLVIDELINIAGPGKNEKLSDESIRVQIPSGEEHSERKVFQVHVPQPGFYRVSVSIAGPRMTTLSGSTGVFVEKESSGGRFEILSIEEGQKTVVLTSPSKVARFLTIVRYRIHPEGEAARWTGKYKIWAPEGKVIEALDASLVNSYTYEFIQGYVRGGIPLLAKLERDFPVGFATLPGVTGIYRMEMILEGEGWSRRSLSFTFEVKRGW